MTLCSQSGDHRIDRDLQDCGCSECCVCASDRLIKPFESVLGSGDDVD